MLELRSRPSTDKLPLQTLRPGSFGRPTAGTAHRAPRGGALLAVGLGFCLTALANAQTSAAPETGLAVEPVEQLLERWVGNGRVAGVHARVRRSGEVLLDLRAGGLRIADGETGKTIPENAIYRIFSMTKPITVAAALILVDRGSLDLDQSVASILPEFADATVAVRGTGNEDGESGLAREPAEKPMTVRDLMRHTSGLTYGYFGNSEVDRLVREIEPLDPDSTLADMVRKLGSLPLKHQPGTTWEYGLSTDVLGRVIEVVSGESLDDFFQTELFEPLGMVDTGFSVPESELERTAALYAREGGKLVERRDRSPANAPRLFSGGGGLFSTLSDYERFVTMLVDGGRVGERQLLSEGSVAEMTRDQLDGQKLSGLVSLAVPGGFGLGVSVIPEGRATDRGPGVGTWGWAGAAGTYFWVDPTRELSGILMLQNWQQSGLGPTFRRAVYDALD